MRWRGRRSTAKRRDVALILPDYCARIAVLDFDSFPVGPQGAALAGPLPDEAQRAVRRGFGGGQLLRRSPPAARKFDVVVVVAPLEIVARYEAPFRAAGMNPGLVDHVVLAALELAPEAGR